MITLTVLDYEEGLVYQYIIDTDKELSSDDFEDIIIDQGHKPKDCEWMSHADDTICKITLTPTYRTL